MSRYEQGKERARAEAIEWQHTAKGLSYGELAEAADRFTQLAKRFGLVREFQENGII